MKNTPLEIELLEKAAEQGDPKAQYELGEAYYYGKGVLQSYSKAKYWREKAAFQGEFYAYSNKETETPNALRKKVMQEYGKTVETEEARRELIAHIYTTPINTINLNATEQSDAETQYLLALAYLKGEGIEQSYEKAKYWLEKAAKQQHPKAQTLLSIYQEGNILHLYIEMAKKGDGESLFNIGFAYHEGEGVEQSYYKAAYWLDEASYSEERHKKAQSMVGALFFKLDGLVDSRIAEMYLNEAAAEGDFEAKYYLGRLLEEIRNDPVNAAKCYKNPAQQGIADAQYRLARLKILFSELKIEQSYPEAAYWFEKAAEQGVSDAQYSIGSLYYNGMGIEQSYTKAAYWYEKASQNNLPKAQLFLGRCYEQGKGVEQSYTKAVFWWEKAAFQENGVAQYCLAHLYEEGKGVPQSDFKAAFWFEKAAEQGDAMAQLDIAFCYNNGKGVEQCYSKAAYWYEKAAEQGLAKAQHNLGFSYYNGEGVKQSFSKAVEWYQKAAEQGLPQSQFNLALCYRKGEGVEQSLSKAAYWYEKAAEQGHAKAQHNLRLLTENIKKQNLTN
jgi:tetratricopeptide repeat protein